MKKLNRLAEESSPYLQQHSQNPVDWYPWSTEALGRARKEQKPIFLSIGYSACHWCHVMERESFENEETARLMNEHFINIKVDREERQDLDHIYMNAVQVMTQHGGWPMSVFLTPELEPFYGGTYFPPDDRMGLPSFKRVLAGVAHAWETKRDEVVKSAKQLTGALDEMSRSNFGAPGTKLSHDLLDNALAAISGNFDPSHGGFGSAPKFFHSMDLKVCLRQWKRTGNKAALDMVTLTLDHWARGGIYDQLGGGFHRYSTDQKWLVPHFEKMLYDNALLSEIYLEAFQVTKNPELSRIANETLDFVLREMTSPEGGFFSTQDADSEGVEGKFYVWSRAEIFSLLDTELAPQICREYGVTEEGNWEGTNILHRPSTKREMSEMDLATARRKLFAARARRTTPFRDEKVLVSWNGLMIHSMALAHQVLGDERFLEAARNAARFVLEKMGPGWEGTGELQHAYKDGRARFSAYLDDYGALASALVTLYESDFDPKWLKAAEGLVGRMLSEFRDKENGGFFYTSKSHEKLITRPKETHDGATPSATSLAVLVLCRLGKLLGKPELLKAAEETLQTCEKIMRLIPTASGQLLASVDFLLGSPKEILLAWGTSEEERESILHHVRETFLPNKVVGLARPGQKSIDGKTSVYVCESFTCQAPLVGLETVKEQLG